MEKRSRLSTWSYGNDRHAISRPYDTELPRLVDDDSVGRTDFLHTFNTRSAGEYDRLGAVNLFQECQISGWLQGFKERLMGGQEGLNSKPLLIGA